MSRMRIYLYQSALLIAAVTPLAFAEQSWLHWSIAAIAVIVGGWRSARGKSALMSRTADGVIIVAAFLLLLLEYFWFWAPPVLALSHFMVLVCACKMLQNQNHRDQTQVMVLCLLLLVVAAIVSGDILFPLVLLLYVTLGLHTLILLRLDLDWRRTRRHNLDASAGPARRTLAEVDSPGHRSPAVSSTAAAVVSLTVGVLVFLFCPRVGAGMFGRLDTGGKAISGFAASLSFDAIGSIQLSEKPVMVVTLRTEGAAPAEIDAAQLYFRGAVFDRYRQERGPGDSWQWRNADDSPKARLELAAAQDTGPDKTVSLLYPDSLPDETPFLYQQYLTQPLDHPYLFCCYPPLEIHSTQLQQVTKNQSNQTIRLSGKAQNSLRYEVVSIMRDSEGRLPIEVVDCLSAERLPELQPPVLPPNPPLPRETEIRALVEHLSETVGLQGSLDMAQQRLTFARAVMDFLNGPTFVYSLQSGPPGERDPIGNFLLSRRQGYCQHFAAAMTILCQYRGIPARVVSGYHGGDYNTLGDCLVVREKHAHSWVELYVPGMDWVTFDPTPSAGTSALRAKPRFLALYQYLDYLQYQWANLVVTYDSQARDQLATNFEQWLRKPTGKEETLVGAVAAFMRELIWWRVDLGFRNRLLYWIFAIMVTVMTVLIGYVITVATYKAVTRLRRLRAMRRSRRPSDVVDFYDRFRGLVDALGLRRRPHQTPIEFAEELAHRFPAMAGAIELVSAYYQVGYGCRDLGADRRATIDAFLHRLAGIEQLRPALNEAPLERPAD